MQFTSRTAESYDPGEYNWSVEGLAEREGAWTPRPEFEPTRDEFPWRDPEFGLHYRYVGGDTDEPWECESGGFYGAQDLEWAPRDRYRNRILIALRKYVETSGDVIAEARAVENALNVGLFEHIPWAENQHARRVLALLTTLTNGASK